MKYRRICLTIIFILLIYPTLVHGFGIYVDPTFQDPLWDAAHQTQQFGSQNATKRGWVAARTFVLGENAKPIWVKYDAQGQIAEEIGEAYEEPLASATVMPASTYWFYVEGFHAIEKLHRGHMEVIDTAEYKSRSFQYSDDSPVKKPSLRPGTITVVVRTQDALTSPSLPLILFEAPIDLNRIQELPEDALALLLSQEGEVLETADVNIGYKVAFYSTLDGEDVPLGFEAMAGFKPQYHKLWGPVSGAEVGVVAAGPPTITDEYGEFAARYEKLCPGFTNTIYAKLRYMDFNPRLPANMRGIYYVYHKTYDNCDAWSPYVWYKFPIDVSVVTGMAILKNGSDTVLLADKTMYDSSYDPPLLSMGDLKEPTSLAVKLRDVPDPDIDSDPLSLYLWEQFSSAAQDLLSEYDDKSGPPSEFLQRVLVQELNQQLQGPSFYDADRFSDVTLSEATQLLMAQRPAGGEDLIRLNRLLLEDAYPREIAKSLPYTGPPGLLKTISEEDLRNTDLYIYRLSNDQLINSLRGLDDTVAHHTSDIIGQQTSLIAYHSMIRGVGSHYGSDMWGTYNLLTWQAASNVNPELRGFGADHLRTGEKVKVIMVNRATGYIGSAIAEVGTGLSQGLVECAPDVIEMQPPNLKIKAERTYLVEDGLTAGEERCNIIGFEGSGLISDKYIMISTEWLDHDGTPLPEDLPGYTGRLAKVVDENVLDQASGQIANFRIPPGRHIQLVQLPRELLDNVHFYVHVSGEPYERNPDFSSIGAGEGALEYRPKHYVPLRVPVFDEEATRKDILARASLSDRQWAPEMPIPVLEDIEKVYQWPYRPEFQFSLFELSFENLDLGTEYDYEQGRSVTTLGIDYDLYSDPNLDPLERFGADRELLFGLGFAAFLALTGEDQHAEIGGLEDLHAMMPAQQLAILQDILGLLQPEDYLGLQLYQADDAGNPLFELYPFPLLISESKPFKVERVYQTSVFNNNIPSGIGGGFTDTYQAFQFQLLHPCKVSVKVLDVNGNPTGFLVNEQSLAIGTYNFMVDYEGLLSLGLLPSTSPRFFVELEAKAIHDDSLPQEIIRPGPDDPDPFIQKVVYPGQMVERYQSRMLGQIMVHDVLIQDGSLNLSRQDIALKGRGPQLAFTRAYSNLSAPAGENPLGDGWSHNLDMKLWPLCAQVQADDSLPQWVRDLRGEFFGSEDIPAAEDEWTAVSVNGTVFKKYLGAWYAERGRHGTLQEIEDSFIYTSKDGTRYYYDVPRRAPGTDIGRVPSHMSIGDGAITTIGIDPDALRLSNTTASLLSEDDLKDPTRLAIKLRDAPEPLSLYLQQQFSLDTQELLSEYDDSSPPSKSLESALIWELNELLEGSSLYDADRFAHVTLSQETQQRIKQNPEGAELIRLNRFLLEDAYPHEIGQSKISYTRPHPASLALPSPVKRIEDRNGNTMTFSYNGAGLVEKVTDAVDRTLVFSYDVVPAVRPQDTGMRLTQVTGPDGIVLEFTYNQEGLLETAARATRIETYAYEQELGVAGGDYNIVSVTDANNHTYAYAYYDPEEIPASLLNFTKNLKSQDVVKQVTYPDNAFSQFQYDIKNGNIRTVTDLRGNDTVYTLNYHGNPNKIEEPLGKTTLMTWSIDGPGDDNVMTSKTDGRNNTTLYEYDGKGNITKETDPYGNAIVTTWNQQFSLPLSRTDRNNVTQTWSYDATGNLTKYVDGDNKEFFYSNYPTGERKSETTPKGYTTHYTYDQYGNPDTVSEAEGSVTNFDYDIRGRLVAQRDPNQNTTQYTYDALDYPAQITHPQITAYGLPEGSTNIQTFFYDPVGNLLSETNRLGLTLTYTYTPRDQVATITRNTGGVKAFAYDENGNLLSETDWKGVATTHTYNALNQRISTNNRLGATMQMAYDVEGNLTQVTDYEGRITTHQYDNLNRLINTQEPALPGQDPGRLVYTYYAEADPATNLKTETDQEGNTTTYEYNGRYLHTKRINALTGEYVWDYDKSGNLTQEIDEATKTTTYEYDGQNRRIKMTQMGGIQTSYQYDANGNQTHITDARGNTTTIKYDAWNRAYQVTDPDNYTTKTAYDGEGNEVKVTDGNGHFRTWQRDARGLVLAATDAENNTTNYTYDLNGNVETITDPRGVVTQTTYDAEDRVNTVTEAFGTDHSRTRQVVSRDNMGNPTEEKDFLGNSTYTTYNPLNLVATVTDALGNTATTTYYKTGKVHTLTNRRGKTTTYLYDALNREIKVTDALDQSIDTTYDAVGNVKTVNDKRSITTTNSYDDLHRLVSVDRAGVRIVTNEYDPVGNLTAVIDAEDNRTEHAYTGRNLLDTTMYPDTTTESRTYDGMGNLLTLTNEEGKVTTYTYDKENRETSVTFAGETTTKAYDTVGNLTSITKPEGNARTMAYDDFNRLVAVTDDEGGLNLTTQYEYDANDNQRHQYDPNGNHVEFTYDLLNRKTAHIQHKGGGNLITQYTQYDEEGNLKETIDPKGQTVTYDYDALDRQVVVHYPNTGAPYLTVTGITTAYDGNNNVTQVTETKQVSGGGTITDTTVNEYDNFDRLTSSTQRGLAITYTYDNNGNRTSVTTTAGTTTYDFDSRNRLVEATVGADETHYTYYPDGKKDTVTYPNGTDVKYTYHATNRVATVVNKVTASDAIISSYTYAYDHNGNRTSQIEVQDGTTETTTYNYDAADRLIDFTITDGTDTTLTEYTYQGYNRATEKVTENDTVTKDRSYTYDETNWLTSVEDTAPGNAKTITYTYDNNGNTLSRSDSSAPAEDTRFLYDSRNQLVQTVRGPPETETILGQYDYNSEGLRVRHRYSDRGDVDYYYDDTAVIEEHNASDGSLLAHYRYADRLLSLDTGSSVQYYHHDALGSTVNLTTANATVQVSYKLDPWGHIRSQTGSSVNRQVFTGQEHDENTGLIYFGARFYDPDTARFITQDSYMGQPGVPPSLHRYLYAYSNPTVYIDLTGNAPITSHVAKFLHGLSDDSKEALVDLNREREDAGFWKGMGLSTTAALMGIGNAVFDIGAGAADIADLGADFGISRSALLKNTEIGQESSARIERTKETAKELAKTGYQLALLTVEDPGGMAEMAVTSAYEASATYLRKTFIEGDLTHTASFSGFMFEMAMPSGKGLEKIGKFPKIGGLSKLTNLGDSKAVSALRNRFKGFLTGESGFKRRFDDLARQILGGSKRADFSVVHRGVDDISADTSWFNLNKVLENMRSSDIGRFVLEAAESHKFRLEFARGMYKKGILLINDPRIMGAAFQKKAKVYLSAISKQYSPGQRTITAATTAIHEGLHKLGISGSQKAEVLCRLAEKMHLGVKINRKVIKETILEMKSTGFYEDLPWRIGKGGL